MPLVDRLSDEELSSLQRGDAGALEEVLLRLMPMVRGWVFRFVGPGDAAEDATQEALIELAAALPRFRGEASVATFARRIVLRACSRWLRRRGARPRPEGDAARDPRDLRTPENRAIAHQELARLYACLARLPATRRSAFMLCAVEGLTPKEAARIEGTSALVMRSRLSRARRDIARLLQQDDSAHAARRPSEAQ